MKIKYISLTQTATNGICFQDPLMDCGPQFDSYAAFCSIKGFLIHVCGWVITEMIIYIWMFVGENEIYVHVCRTSQICKIYLLDNHHTDAPQSMESCGPPNCFRLSRMYLCVLFLSSSSNEFQSAVCYLQSFTKECSLCPVGDLCVHFRALKMFFKRPKMSDEVTGKIWRDWQKWKSVVHSTIFVCYRVGWEQPIYHQFSHTIYWKFF
jgi:hypothetical protein